LSLERKKHYEHILPDVAIQTSKREELSEKLEYRVRDMMATKWMRDKVGESFEGTISGMIAKGFFVELENTIEGFIDITKSSFSFDESSFIIFDSQTGKELQF